MAIPQQENGDDCGVFVCQGAKCFVFQEDITFLNQAWVKGRRDEMMEEIRHDKINSSMG